MCFFPGLGYDYLLPRSRARLRAFCGEGGARSSWPLWLVACGIHWYSAAAQVNRTDRCCATIIVVCPFILDLHCTLEDILHWACDASRVDMCLGVSRLDIQTNTNKHSNTTHNTTTTSTNAKRSARRPIPFHRNDDRRKILTSFFFLTITPRLRQKKSRGIRRMMMMMMRHTTNI